MTYPDGSHVTRTYNALDRLTGVTDWQGRTSTFGYDRDSNPITATLPTTGGVISLSQGYNAADQLTAITATQAGGTLWSASYGRDPLGQVIMSTDTLGPRGHSYSYNPLDQLTADQAVSGTSALTQTWTNVNLPRSILRRCPLFADICVHLRLISPIPPCHLRASVSPW